MFYQETFFRGNGNCSTRLGLVLVTMVLGENDFKISYHRSLLSGGKSTGILPEVGEICGMPSHCCPGYQDSFATKACRCLLCADQGSISAIKHEMIRVRQIRGTKKWNMIFPSPRFSSFWFGITLPRVKTVLSNKCEVHQQNSYMNEHSQTKTPPYRTRGCHKRKKIPINATQNSLPKKRVRCVHQKGTGFARVHHSL